MEDLVIRKANATDLDAIRELFRNTILFINIQDYTPKQTEVWASGYENVERWKRKINEQLFLVAEKGNSIVGIGTLENKDHIDLLYVHKDHQRSGIASALLDKLLIAAKEYGTTKLSSDVSITARPFFESKGFVAITEQKVKVKGILLTNYKMEIDF